MSEICAGLRSNEQKSLLSFVNSTTAEIRVAVPIGSGDCEALFVRRGKRPVTSTSLPPEAKLQLDQFLIPLIGKDAYQNDEVLILPGTLSSHCGVLNGYAILVFVGKNTYVIANIHEMKEGVPNEMFCLLYKDTRSLVIA